MYACENWTIRKAECQRTHAFDLWCRRKLSWESLDCKEIKPFNPKGNQSWIFIGRTDAEAEAPILWPPDAKNWLIGKNPDNGKDWRQEKKDDRGWDGWMAPLTQWTWVWEAPGVGDGQGSLACYRPSENKELDITEQLNWLNWFGYFMGLLSTQIMLISFSLPKSVFIIVPRNQTYLYLSISEVHKILNQNF